MKKLLAAIMVLGIVFWTVPISIYAEEFPPLEPEPYKSEIDLNSDAYIIFGNAQYPDNIPYGIDLSIDLPSTSTFVVNLGFGVSPEIIEKRKIDRFHVLANNKIVDTVYVQWQDIDDNGVPDPVGYYIVKPEAIWFAGGAISFQIIGVNVSNFGMNVGGKPQEVHNVVAWSGISNPVNMKPVRVNDAEAINVLNAILAKLDQMLNTLANKLDKIKEELQTLFTPSPEAEARLNKAMDELLKATPMGQMTEKSSEMKNMFENTQLDQPMERLTFGEKRDWLNMGFEFYLFDLTDLKEQVEILRNFLAAIIWVEFFVWIVFYLAPKLEV